MRSRSSSLWSERFSRSSTWFRARLPITSHLKQFGKQLWTTKKFPTWIKGVARVEPFQSLNGYPGWTEIESNGMKIPLQVTEAIPPRHLVTRIADPKLPWGGTWTTEITPAAGGSVMRITEDGYVNNPLFRFMARFVFGYTSTLDSYMKSLGEKFGEQVTLQN